jgi:hypothetical protein
MVGDFLIGANSYKNTLMVGDFLTPRGKQLQKCKPQEFA